MQGCKDAEVEGYRAHVEGCRGRVGEERLPSTAPVGRRGGSAVWPRTALLLRWSCHCSAALQGCGREARARGDRGAAAAATAGQEGGPGGRWRDRPDRSPGQEEQERSSETSHPAIGHWTPGYLWACLE